MSLKQLDPFADQGPDFNRVVAKRVYDDIMALPDGEAARMYAVMAISGALQQDLIVHGKLISKAIAGMYTAKADELKKTLVKGYISKAQSGDEPDAVIAAVEALAKAWDPEQFDTESRSQRAQRQFRTSGGRFGVSHHRVEYSSDVKGPIPDKHLKAVTGRDIPDHGLKGEQAARFQQAYAQVSALVAPYTRMGGDALLHLNYDDDRDNTIVSVPSSKAVLPIDPNRPLYSASVSVTPPSTAGGAAFDALRAVGSPELGSFAAGLDRVSPNGVREFGNQFNHRPEANENFRPTNRLFRRLESSSRLLEDALGDNAPTKVKYALAVGRKAGELGPEAQKVIGPGADRAAYRYRGTERKLDQRLVNATATDRSRLEHKTAASARQKMIHGSDLLDSRSNVRGWQPSETLMYFRRLLPSQTLNALQLASGNVPPSQGVIIDKTGKLAVQSVGYGDDHYLPFDLTKLSRLRGGEYIRTRSWGGPTTEDVYTGLVSGARSITVLSHNGTFTMEFDPTFRGTRRYNDKAARMVARYGQLLDAVKNGEVATGEIAPSRMAELRRSAELVADPDENLPAFRREVARLESRERANPTFSAEQIRETQADFLQDVADRVSMGGSSRDRLGGQQSSPATVDLLREQYIANRLTEYRAQASRHGITPSPETVNSFGMGVTNQVVTDEGLIEALGLGNRYKVFADRRLESYKRSLKPLRLDGNGYAAALDALQEQFPYYISSVKFHPWEDDRGRPGGPDTGYIKPRHNRPESALAGYFDRTVTGFRKVTADSIRNQNGRSLNHVENVRSDQREERKAPEEEARGGNGNNIAQRVRKIHAAKELAHEMIGTTTLPNGNALPAWVRFNEDKSGPGADLRTLMNMDEDEIDEMAENEPAAFQDLVGKAYAAGHAQGIFGESVRAKARAFRGETAAAAKPFTLEGAVLNSGGEFNFGRIFAPGSHSLDDMRNAYGEDGDIQVARAAHRLPEFLDEDFVSKVNAGIEKIKGEFAGDMGNEPAHLTRLERQMKGLLKARQLHRHYNEIVAHQAEQAAAEGAVDEERVMVIPVDSDTVRQWSDRGAVPLNPERRAIGGVAEVPVEDAAAIARRLMEEARSNREGSS